MTIGSAATSSPVPADPVVASATRASDPGSPPEPLRWLADTGAEWTTDQQILGRSRLDRSGWEPDGRPAAVVFPRTVTQVQAVLRGASATRTPLVPRGAGTALTGASTAGAGTVVIDLSRMNRIVEIRAADGIAIAEPGVVTADLDRAAAEHGLSYAPDPASVEISTIGGNIATNAGGLRCAKYGVTRDSVLGLDVVLADGTLINTGRATLKSVTGYDLTGLFVGSEGTLGVVVGATLRLRTLPTPTATIAAAYPDIATAAAASVALTGAHVQPVLAELLDEATLSALADHGLRQSGGALLIVQLDGGPVETSRALEVLRRGATSVRSDGDPAELLAARRQALPAIERLGRPLIEDIAVPRSRLAAAVRSIADIAQRHDVPICTLAHAGDGNLHPIIVAGSHGSPIPSAAHRAADDIFALALSLGGTVTGEHGVGVLKRAWLARELGEEQHHLQRRIKAVFDPLGILNPGKAI
ncbi:FAD-linked oxidase [Actinoplanes philippinensis]|uniref:Glycolate oxidase n=1 Tax=Actinoplanes philippinensis TaxID=35752 RepID=A0A1I2KCU0_9ACTN|nr:FAD-linked oxidase C-terminal domain-containing protein [Actinoplanes philippinensis]GIE81945.1 FAD-linked oxidase [Actinoplanes philippinensis]SFF64875.1 glycolate oxidase [Actinoplanes philippinensis]